VIIGVCTGTGCLLLLCLAALVYMQRRGKLNRTLLGKMLPPGLGPLTTLVCAWKGGEGSC
jgi:hypothetical protein